MTTKINQNALALLSRLKITQGPNNAAAPFVWLKIEAIGTFKVLFICLDYFFLYRNQMLQEPENVKMISPKIFEFFAAEAKVEKVTEKE